MIRLRLTMLFLFFALCSGVLIFRAFQLQVVPSKNVKRLASRQLHKTIDIVGRRGAIRDRKGRELAVSVNSSSIFINPHLIKNPKRVASTLSAILGTPQERILDRIRKSRGKKFVWLERQLDHAQMARLKSVGIEKLDGVGLLPEFRRDYPHSSLASHVLGYVSIDGKGLAGLEYTNDTALVGGKKSFTVLRDARGRPIFGQMDQIRHEDMKGQDLDLTIDISLQGRVERILEEAVERHQADAATAVVMNPHTGEILSLANYPNFDPNNVRISNAEGRRNRAVTDMLEPGSVVKAFVVAKALEDKVVKATTVLSGGGGKIKIGRKTITESDRKHYADKVSIKDLIRLSSNVATVNLQRKMGFDRVAEVYRQLGFGMTTGLGLPGESRGIFRIPGPKQQLEQATMSFGHGMAVTPIQMAVAFASLANGGYRVTPKIVQNRSGVDPSPANAKIFSDTTLKQIRRMLEQVVENEGTGSLARIEGYRAAGKTGTALKVDPKGGYMRGAYWSSFAGFFPSDNPELVVYVMVDHPRKDGKYAGAVAAPLFSDIVKSYLGVGAASASSLVARRSPAQDRPSGKATVLLGEDPTKEAFDALQKKLMPNLLGLSLTEALRVLEEGEQPVDILRPGRVIAEQLPKSGEKLAQGERVRLKLR